jgi:hypothetical protein
MARPIFVVSLVSMMIAVLPASANIVTIGGPNVAPDIFPSSNFTGLTELADTGIQPFSFDGMNGNYEEVVVSDPANTFCAGCLDFALAVFLGADEPFGISTVRLGIWGNSTTDVGYSPGLDNGTIVPTTVFRGTGNNVGFNFSNLGSGTFTDVLIVETNATAFWNQGVIFFNDTNNNTQSSGFGPIFVPAPEPSTAALTGLAILAFAGLVRMRSRADIG